MFFFFFTCAHMRISKLARKLWQDINVEEQANTLKWTQGREALQVSPNLWSEIKQVHGGHLQIRFPAPGTECSFRTANANRFPPVFFYAAENISSEHLHFICVKAGR